MENSKIEWTDHTFNPWHGCMKVSEGCKNCYAETMDNRWNGGHWGPGSERKEMSEDHWRKPFKWNEDARKAGIKAKVFCASMADVFEDHEQLPVLRDRLFNVIADTPYLVWQLLTKRPENILNMVPERWLTEWPFNVWIGTSVENQKAADERILHLLQVPAKVKFLSCEPLLGHLNIANRLKPTVCHYTDGSGQGYILPALNWVICGGESGPKARPMHPQWARSLRDQCAAAGVPFFFKQNGEWVSVSEVSGPGDHYKFDDGSTVRKTGKKLAGALLDGKEHKEFPA